MADNVQITAGSGTTIATDEVQVGGTNPLAHVQFVKLVDGSLNGTNPIQSNGSGSMKVSIQENGVTSAVAGVEVHDSAYTGNPLMASVLYAKAAAPTDVSADGDAVRPWALRNGSQVVNLAAGGALIPGDATNGLKVNVMAFTPAVQVTGAAAHDAVSTGNPVLQGGYASAAAPADVSADGDAVRAWHLRNGAYAVNLTAAGALIPGNATTGLLVNPQSSRLRITVTPTCSTTLYTAADQIGGVMTFANAALANGGKGKIVNALMTSRDTESPVIELWIFQVSPTMVGSDNAAFDITDANLEAGILQTVIEFVSYNKTASGEVSFGQVRGQPLSPATAASYICGGSTTSIYGVMCVRSGPTLGTTTDLVVSLDVERES